MPAQYIPKARRPFEIRGRTAREIAASIERALLDGFLLPGEQLPTIRALAASLGVSPMTVASAYRELRHRALLTSGGRRGTRISQRPPLALPNLPVIPAGARDLATGNPDPRLLPSLPKTTGGADPRSRLYGTRAKLDALVELAADQLGAEGVPASHLTVTAGALDAVERALAVHLQPGDTVAVEDPGFSRIFDLVRGASLELTPVRVDDFGPLPDDVEHALAGGARAIIITPRAQNPFGAALDEARAAELRKLLGAYPDVLVIEDDHAGLVAGSPALTLCEADRPRFAIARSVSKWLGPDLRLAILSGDATTIARVEGRQLLGPGWVSHILQQLVVALWSDPNMEERMRHAADEYSARRAALIAALARHDIAAHGRSGLNVWVPVREEAAVSAGLLARGWAVAAGELSRLRTPPAIRVTTAALGVDEAEAFAADLAETLAPGAGTYSA